MFFYVVNNTVGGNEITEYPNNSNIKYPKLIFGLWSYPAYGLLLIKCVSENVRYSYVMTTTNDDSGYKHSLASKRLRIF
jgi:hypothetical protein